MKKITVAWRILFGALFAVSLTSPALATKPATNLSGDTDVILELKNPKKELQRLGKTNLYKTDLSTAKKLTDNFHPIIDYTPVALANDPLEPQGYLTLLDASETWDISVGNTETVVAVIDSGFALDHEDLAGRWHQNVNELGATITEGPPPNCTSRSLPMDKSCNNLDDDSNGYVDDWQGWDFAQSDNDPVAGSTNSSGDAVDHGTSVAGLVGVTGNNSVGAASLNWSAKILPLQVFTDDGAATTVEVAEAIAYAIDNGADVINLSLGSTAADSAIETLLEQADSEGIVVVASAGNCGGSSYEANGCTYQGQMLYPATSDYSIAVAASDLGDERASFSSQGVMIDVMAPGSGAIISSTYTASNATSAYTGTLYGTSFSAPITTGAMSLLKTVWPGATAKELRAVLVDSAANTSEMGSNQFTSDHGWGRIQPAELLSLAESCLGAIDADINCDSSVNTVDLSIFASQWNMSRSGRTDINLSGKVDVVDLSIFASKWGQ